jgi:uncharacterized membrane-anchored protein YjiN (DUF445 family)
MKSKLDKDAERGNRAEAILSDPIMVEAREHIESELWRLFKSSVPTDTEALSQIKAMQYMHAKYEAFLKSCVQDGKIARIEIERKRKSLRERVFG